ncbi:MAG TPA: hypothetical protein VLG93_08560 [Sulfuricaulis sp.]|nr:hypothetical protein [Sulfuricaulis sp.]
MSILQTKTDSEVRAAAKKIYGAKNAKVTRNGEVHVRGVMPNTSKTGWYLLGFTGQVELEEKLFHSDGSLRHA